jgi:hypothetical protein
LAKVFIWLSMGWVDEWILCQSLLASFDHAIWTLV